MYQRVRRGTPETDFKVTDIDIHFNFSAIWPFSLCSCVDKSSGRKIRKKFCGPRSSRPNGKRRRCNTFPCDFEWTAERWEECTHTCGSQGLQIRPVYCIPSNMNETQGQLWRKMVDPRKCPGDRPMRIRECNRIPCPAKWVSTGTVVWLCSQGNDTNTTEFPSSRTKLGPKKGCL